MHIQYNAGTSATNVVGALAAYGAL